MLRYPKQPIVIIRDIPSQIEQTIAIVQFFLCKNGRRIEARHREVNRIRIFWITRNECLFIGFWIDFHNITKNKAINKAKSTWILQLDADERITPEMKKEIIGILEGSYFGFDSWISPLRTNVNKLFKIFPEPKPLIAAASAYWLPRKNFFLSRYLKNTGQYPDPVIRLFQRGKAILPAKDVHEQMKVKGVVGWLKSDLDHYATPDFSRYLLHEDRYSSLQARFYKEAGVKINIFNTLKYLFFKPAGTFLNLYIRRRGFLDGFPGFVFSLYSGLHHAFSYMKLWEIYKNEEYGKKN